MKSLKQSAQDYIRMRRLLGFKMRHEERRLRRFVSFMELQKATYITTKLALTWAMEPADAQPATWAERLMCVRVFARYCSGADPRTEVPPLGILPFRAQRATPYLYSEQQIRRLMEAARGLAPSGGLRGLTYRCLFGLLTVTGLRISEALALTRDDVDLRNGLLTIRGAKFGKTRLVPLHASACRALARYAQQRDALLNPPSVSPDTRDRITRHMLALSTYMGHARLESTYWYLESTPQLMADIADLCESFVQGGSR
jgi:site-specific recombinase XerD